MKNGKKIKNWIKEHRVELATVATVYGTLMAGVIIGRKYEAKLFKTGLAFAVTADPTLADHIEEASKKALESVKKV